MNIEIIPGTLDHLHGFHAAFAVVAGEQRYLGRTDAPKIEELRKFLTENIARKNVIIVAVAGDNVVGWCDISRSRRDAMCHSGGLGMGLLPNYRGQGIGTKVLEASLIAAKQADIPRVELSVYTDNAPAIALYRKFGFKHEGIMKSFAYLRGKYVDACMMARIDEEALAAFTARSSS